VCREGLLVLQNAHELLNEVLESKQFSALEGGSIDTFIDREEKRYDVKDPASVSADVLIKLMYEDVASLGKIALVVDLATQRQAALAQRFQLESSRKL
jgi:hypothetical protein